MNSKAAGGGDYLVKEITTISIDLFRHLKTSIGIRFQYFLWIPC
jgi:hypothetical protein